MGGHELVMCEEVRWEEVVEVMECLKRGKATGPDGNMNNVWGRMVGGGDVADDECGDEEECCPLDWKRSLVLPLHKDGNVEQVGNYRGIVLGYSVVKVLARVLARRLGRFAEVRILTSTGRF